MLNVISGVLAPAFTVTNSYESIQTVTVGSGGAPSITFSSIPSTYKHLEIRGIGYNTGGYSLCVNFNNDTGSNYWYHRLWGNGASASAGSSGSAAGFIAVLSGAGLGNATNTFSASVITILDYTNTNKNKTLRHLGGVDYNGSGGIEFDSGVWNSTTAISTITLAPFSGSFGQYTEYALYGIKG